MGTNMTTAIMDMWKVWSLNSAMENWLFLKWPKFRNGWAERRCTMMNTAAITKNRPCTGR